MLTVITTGIIVWLLYLYGMKSFNYWKNKGVKYDKAYPFIGSVAKLVAHKVSVSDYITDLYNRYPDEKFVGFYLAGLKCLVLRDLDLIKCVLGTDFHSFYKRGLNYHDEVIEPLLKNLFFADGDLWKLLRQRMTPAFTTGKLKAMFPLIVETTQKLKTVAAAAAQSGAPLDVRDLMARYTTDFIGACGFGIDIKSIDDENSTFRELGRRIFRPNARDSSVAVLKRLAPDLFKNLNALSPEIENIMFPLVKGILKARDYKKSGRNDFIDLLLELKEKGTILGESLEKRNPGGSPQTVSLELDESLMAAQVFVFFAAGFETSSSATSFTLHQLAFHPDAQRKCQQEIDEVLRRHDNQLCYDAVKEMKYLEMCFKEGMRIFPSLGFVSRVCVNKYTLPGTNVTIDPETPVVIPIQALHTDSKYFEEPEKFRPERFHPDNVKNIKSFAYLPFGEGPRACIGERLGVMQSLAGLAALLSQFTVRPARSTLRTPVTDPSAHVVQSIKGGIPLIVELRKD